MKQVQRQTDEMSDCFDGSEWAGAKQGQIKADLNLDTLPHTPDVYSDLKEMVQDLWTENMRLINDARKLRYTITELRYDNAMLKAELNSIRGRRTK